MTKDQLSTLIVSAAAGLYLALLLYLILDHFGIYAYVTPFLDALDRGDMWAIGVVSGLALGAAVLGMRR